MSECCQTHLCPPLKNAIPVQQLFYESVANYQYSQSTRYKSRIEILTKIDGVEFELCYKNRNKVIIDDVEIPLISLEDLKINKKASGKRTMSFERNA